MEIYATKIIKVFSVQNIKSKKNFHKELFFRNYNSKKNYHQIKLISNYKQNKIK